MIISLEELKNRDFFLSRINVFHQKPTYRELRATGRKYNGLLYILQGKCHYYHENGDFSLAAGSLVYLPYGSVHRLVIESENIEFYRIDFRLEVDGEVALFSNHPTKLCHTAPAECAEAIRSLAESYQFLHDSIGKTGLLCTILHSLSAATHNPRREKLAPAVNYLTAHLTEKVRCTYLAELCCLSEAQFYNLFHAEYGMPPLEYRSALLVKRAALLLKDGSFTVTEVAEMLGFESVAYFSRFFKKHTGNSPIRYKKR